MGNQQPLGQSGLKVSPIGFGAFKIGRNQGIKYPSGYELPDQRTVDRLLNEVLDLGINYIDTAPAYGLSEERIGQAIAHRRREYIISTKAGEIFENGRSSYDFTQRAVHQSVHRSLRRLRTDVLDIVFVHATHDDRNVLDETDVVPALHALRDEGLILRIGLSAYTTEAFDAALSWADAIMLEYHLENRTLEPVMAAASERSVAVIVKKGLGSGHLHAAQAIEFVLSNTGVTSLLIGSLNLNHLRDNVRVAMAVRGETSQQSEVK